MTNPDPFNGGAHLYEPKDTGEREATEEAQTYCRICKSSSHAALECPFTLFSGLRDGAMTFQRRATAVEEGQPPFRDSIPQHGDSPVYRPPVPLAPRALRSTNSALPLLVFSPAASPSSTPSQERMMITHATDDTATNHLTTSKMETEKNRGKNEDLKDVDNFPKKLVT